MMKNLRTYDVTELRFNPIYQRVFEQPRYNEIKESINKNGYWDHSIIVVNRKLEVVDGQHRWQAAKNCGIRRVTVSVVDFESKEKEAEFFWTINNYKSTHLKTKDYWFARYMSSDVIANALYSLCDYNISSLYKKIALKGHDTFSKLNINSALSLINYSVSGTVHNWERSRDDYLASNINKIGIKEVVSRTNDIMNFIYGTFGIISKQNPKPYGTSNFRAILIFHKLLDQNDLLDDAAKKKMQSFIFTSEFDRLPRVMKVQSLVNWFNSKRTKNKIEYKL